MSAVEVPGRNQRPDRKSSLREMKFQHIFKVTCRLLLRPWLDLEVEGIANLPPEGGVILAANHPSDEDFYLLVMTVPRPLFSMLEAGTFQKPVRGAMLRALGAFPAYRHGREDPSQSHAWDILTSGQAMVIFPEGTPSRGRGLKVAQSSAARLALAANCPILPVALDGSHQFHKRLLHRARVRVRLCEPIQPRPGELALALTDRLMYGLASNLPAALRGVYAERPRGF